MFKNVFFIGVLLVSTLGLGGCGSSSSGDGTFDGKAFLFVGSHTLTQSSATLSGTGSLVFVSPLASATSNDSYRLAFSLNEGGSLSLVAHSSSTLTGGITLKFTRTGTTLGASLITAEGTTDVSAAFAGVDASTALTFQVDVHNAESPTHVLVWGSAITSFEEGNASLNSEDTGLEAKGQGTGTYWGLTLSNASVTSAALGEAKFSE